MNFDFPDDNKLVQDQIHRYLRDNCDLSVFRSVLEGNEGCATSVWQGLVEMAVQGSAIPEALGGVQVDYLTLARRRERLLGQIPSS